MNKLGKVVIILIISFVSLGLVVLYQSGTGNNYVPYLSFGILILIYLMFRKKDNN